MKYSVFAVAGAALTTAVSASNGFLYTVDESVHSSATQFINSKTASSIVARRRGLTESRYLQETDESILRDINTYGGWQQPMFAANSDSKAPGKLFIRISNYDGEFTGLGDDMPDLWIEEPTKDLKDDFKVQSKQRNTICEHTVPPSLNTPFVKDIEVIFSYPLEDEPTCLSASEIPNIPVILTLHSVLPTSASAVPASINSLTRILRHLSATSNVESTLLLLPSKLAKAPVLHPDLRRREEEPLELPPHVSLSPEHFDTFASSNKSHPLPANVPQCFTTESLCTNTTNACSGHGSCYKAHNLCFKCKCVPTVLSDDKEGRRTVEWGGNACEKIDVSVPFILFATFGVTMTALIVGVIGMMYSMGSQELPSVLSAGVAGTGARK